MLTIYETRSGELVPQSGRPRITDQAIWIDLFNPTLEEEKKIERALKLDVPTREEQQEIEVSSRLYQEEGAYFMTATILLGTDTPEPSTTAVSFILAGQRLITVRYAEPHAFSIFLARAKRSRRQFYEWQCRSRRTDRRHRSPLGRLHRESAGGSQ